MHGIFAGSCEEGNCHAAKLGIRRPAGAVSGSLQKMAVAVVPVASGPAFALKIWHCLAAMMGLVRLSRQSSLP